MNVSQSSRKHPVLVFLLFLFYFTIILELPALKNLTPVVSSINNTDIFEKSMVTEKALTVKKAENIGGLCHRDIFLKFWLTLTQLGSLFLEN